MRFTFRTSLFLLIALFSAVSLRAELAPSYPMGPGDSGLLFPEDPFWDWILAKSKQAEAIPDFGTPYYGGGCTEEGCYDDTTSPGLLEPPLPNTPMDTPLDEVLAPNDLLLTAAATPVTSLMTLPELYQACSLKESTPEGGVKQEYVIVPAVNPGGAPRDVFVCRHFTRALLECAQRLKVPMRYYGFNCNCDTELDRLTALIASPTATPDQQEEARKTKRLLLEGIVKYGHAQAVALVADETNRDQINAVLIEPQGIKNFSGGAGARLPVVIKNVGSVSTLMKLATAWKAVALHGPTLKEVLAAPRAVQFMCGGRNCNMNPPVFGKASGTYPPAVRGYVPATMGYVTNRGQVIARWNGVPENSNFPIYKDPVRGEIKMRRRLGMRSKVGTRQPNDPSAAEAPSLCKYRLSSNLPADMAKARLVCEARTPDDDEDLTKPPPP